MTRNEMRELVRCARCANEYAAFGLASLPQCPRCGGALVAVDAPSEPASAPAEPGGEPMPQATDRDALPPEIVTALDEYARTIYYQARGLPGLHTPEAVERDAARERLTAALLRSLVAAKESAERDAARYRFVREYPLDTLTISDSRVAPRWFDKLVDAAMSAARAGEERDHVE